MQWPLDPIQHWPGQLAQDEATARRRPWPSVYFATCSIFVWKPYKLRTAWKYITLPHWSEWLFFSANKQVQCLFKVRAHEVLGQEIQAAQLEMFRNCDVPKLVLLLRKRNEKVTVANPNHVLSPNWEPSQSNLDFWILFTRRVTFQFGFRGLEIAGVHVFSPFYPSCFHVKPVWMSWGVVFFEVDLVGHMQNPLILRP